MVTELRLRLPLNFGGDQRVVLICKPHRTICAALPTSRITATCDEFACRRQSPALAIRGKQGETQMHADQKRMNANIG